MSEPRRGGGGGAWPPQQPPFSHRFNFRVGWSWSSSNVWFLLPLCVGFGFSDSKRRPGLRSVRRVHGAVASLLLLFLLQEELLQRRRAGLHHGA